MKHTKYTCTHCSIETNKARPVDGMTLCNPCNLVLIKTGKLPEQGAPKLDWFERQRFEYE